MKYLAKKDWLILALFFVLVLSLTSFAAFALTLDETPFEGALSRTPVAGFSAGVGLYLLIPIGVITLPIVLFTYGAAGGVSYEWYFASLPLFATIIYSLCFALALAMYNEREGRKLETKTPR
jgi:hypothetical protein